MKTQNSYDGFVWKKHDWRLGESITEEKMDNIENGIAIAASQIQDIIDNGGGGGGGSGSSLTIISIEYAISDSGLNPPSTDWQPDLPIVEKGKWLWTRITYSNGEEVYSVSYAGTDGADEATIEYAVSSNGDEPPTTGWTTEYFAPQEGQWFWVRTTYSNGNQSFSCSYIGRDGLDGNSVNIVEVVRDQAQSKIYVRLSDNRIVVIRDGQEGERVIDGNLHFAWASNIQIQDNPSTGEPELYTTGFSTLYSVQKEYIGVYASEDTYDSFNPLDYSWTHIKGNGVKNMVEYYGRSARSDTQPSSYSTTIMETTAAEPYLWNYEVLYYAFGDPLTTTPHIISIYSEGKEIASQIEYYARTSTFEPPEKTSELFTTNPMEAYPNEDYPYFWNYEVTTYSDGTSHETDIRLIGTHGQNGISPYAFHLVCEPSVVKREDNGNYSPSSITLSGKYTQGTSTQSNYAGWFRLIGYNKQGVVVNSADSSGSAANSYTFSGLDNWSNVAYFVGLLSKSSNFLVSSNILDTQTIPVVENSMGYTVLLDNEAHIFPGNTLSALPGTVEIGVVAYRGTSRKTTVVDGNAILDVPQSMTVTVSDSNTDHTKLTVTVTSALNQSGVLTIPVIVDSTTFNLKFSYSIAFMGANGSTPTNMQQLYAVNQNSGEGMWPTDANAWDYVVPQLTSDEDVIWVKTRLTWADGSPTETTPVVDYALMRTLRAVETLDQDLYGENIFNRLTNNGQVQGLFWGQKDNHDALFVNAEYINTGYLSADRIEAGTLTISKLDSDTQSAISGAAQVTETVADIQASIGDIEDEIESIKNQSDGSITYWFKEVDPTLQNEPAVDWNTTAIKEEHIGDLYYNTTNNNCWRWLNTNNTYGWNPVQDAGVQEALRKAQEAKDVADGKRRIFFNRPQVPYDEGDVWINDSGGTGEILRCTNSKNSAQSFASSDWISAAEYSDNTLASTANKKVQTIYRSRAINSPYSLYKIWVTDPSGNQNTWTIKRPKYSSNYPYLFTATQTMDVNGTIDCTTPMLDDTTTVIDGGHIITGTIDANNVNVVNLGANSITAGAISLDHLDTDLQTAISSAASSSTTLAYVATCNSDATAAIKEVSVTGFTYVTGAKIIVTMTKCNTISSDSSNLQLSVTGVGSRRIYVKNNPVNASNKLLWGAGAVLTFIFNGTYWVLENEPDIYYGSTCTTAQGNSPKVTTVSSSVPIIFKNCILYLTMQNITTYGNNNSNIPSLQVKDNSGNTLSSQNIYYMKDNQIPKNDLTWSAGQTLCLQFDGQYWRLNDGITVIDGGWIKTGKINANRIDVGSINISDLNGTISFSQIPDGVARTSDIPSDDYITNITNNTIKTTNVVAQNLTVKSANIDGTIAANKITGSTPSNNGWSLNFQTGALTIGNISANNITSGTLTLGGTTSPTLLIKNSSGTEIGRWDKNGISAIKGNIGNWNIENNMLYSFSGSGSSYNGVGLLGSSSGTPSAAIAAGIPLTTNTYAAINAANWWNTAKFAVKYDGSMKATNATITGEINATSGTIGGWSIGSHILQASRTISNSNSWANGKVTTVMLEDGDPSLNHDVLVVRINTQNQTDYQYPFTLKADGSIIATKATITGNITATGGTIGGFSIGQHALAVHNTITINNATKYYLVYLKDGTEGNNHDVFGIRIADDANGTNATWPIALRADGSLSVTGNITATSGKIANWNVQGNMLYTISGSGSSYTGVGMLSSGSAAIAAGIPLTTNTYSAISGANWWNSAKFAVKHDGSMKAVDATISGETTINTTGSISLTGNSGITIGSDNNNKITINKTSGIRVYSTFTQTGLGDIAHTIKIGNEYINTIQNPYEGFSVLSSNSNQTNFWIRMGLANTQAGVQTNNRGFISLATSNSNYIDLYNGTADLSSGDDDDSSASQTTIGRIAIRSSIISLNANRLFLRTNSTHNNSMRLFISPAKSGSKANEKYDDGIGSICILIPSGAMTTKNGHRYGTGNWVKSEVWVRVNEDKYYD